MDKLRPLPESDDEDSLLETQKKVLKELKRQNTIISELLETQKQHSSKIERMFQLHMILDAAVRPNSRMLPPALQDSDITQDYCRNNEPFLEAKNLKEPGFGSYTYTRYFPITK
jgi:hypothetical protein